MVLVREAVIIVAISVMGGLWLAWLLSNRDFPGKQALGVIATIALGVPAPIVCFYLFARSRSWPGLVIAGLLSAAPLIVRAGRNALASLDPIYGKAARGLGASDWRVFSRVEMPLAWRPIAAAAGVASLRVVTELVIVGWIHT